MANMAISTCGPVNTNIYKHRHTRTYMCVCACVCEKEFRMRSIEYSG